VPEAKRNQFAIILKGWKMKNHCWGTDTQLPRIQRGREKEGISEAIKLLGDKTAAFQIMIPAETKKNRRTRRGGSEECR